MPELPFTPEQFFAVFTRYNRAVWPAQIVLSALAAIAVGLAASANRRAGRAVSVLLSGFWLWAGIVYHGLHFRSINPAAALFAALFLAQAVLFALAAARGTLRFGAPERWRQTLGWVLSAYALIVYPLWGAARHPLQALPTFGVPCPTTIATVGLLFWSRNPPRHLLAIPLLWAAIGGTAAFALGVTQDLGLLAAGLCSLLLWRRSACGDAASAREPFSHAASLPG